MIRPRARALTTTSLSLLVFAWACGATGPLEEQTGTDCLTDRDCKEDRICHEDRCVFPEEVERPTAPGDGTVGDPCEEHLDCRQPNFCLTDWPDGYCLLECSLGCPDGSHCVDVDGWRFCMKSCAGNSDCRDGYECRADGGGGRACLARAVDPGAPVGGPCRSDEDCLADPAYCWTEWPEGYCFQYDCANNPCPAGSTCYPSGDDYLCFADCRSSQDCGRQNYVCWRFDGNGVCFPHCSFADVCLAEERCNPDNGLCEPL